MTAERRSELPRSELNEAAEKLFISLFEKLRKNQGLRDALVLRFMWNPSGLGINYEPDKLKFNYKNRECSLSFRRQALTDRIKIGTQDSEGMEEEVMLWLEYKGVKDATCALFGEVGRGDLERAMVGYRKVDWRGDTPARSYVNSSEAVKKAKEFLQRI
ncbi:MAG: hypothetical protein UX13_C0034G0006 [Candidatus Woesebacteria bacterium GW2011_GWB1_45_5]|uniref:Uncharacterized protein n=1 Tax=Candidatus Woesebacteria bacterium GW2011_GWB1_45_5 TaxID=1618581 RepID=A0A0G1MNB6_9BACT|nr:MAG: hypothetical protein UX13_C0034G0006 [Candidatus Woesebacteria bacterium GW2011_GWB1_45_5]